MKSIQRIQARKRAVNLTHREDPVSQAKGVTKNFSGGVEQLLINCLQKHNHTRQEKFHNAAVVAQA